MTLKTKNGSVLIIDEEASARGLYNGLVSEGYSCYEANNGPRAVERLNTDPIDITILDVTIENSSGIDLLPNLVQKYPNTAVIATSDNVVPNILIQCMKNGAQDYIIKPFEVELVVRSIEEILHKRQIESMLKAYHAGLEGKVSEQAKQIRELFLHSIDSLVNALEAKDAYTAGHSRRVNQLSVIISQRRSR